MKKKLSVLLLALIVALGVAACGDDKAGETPQSVSIKEKPQTEFYVGDEFDVTDGKLEVVYKDGTKASFNLTKAMTSGYDMAKAGEQTVTVTYTENDKSVTTSYKIKVTAVAAQSVAVTKNPAKTAYVAGETFDKTGMEVTITYNNGETEKAEDFTVDTTKKLAVKDKSVTVTAGSLTTTVAITVSPKVNAGFEDALTEKNAAVFADYNAHNQGDKIDAGDNYYILAASGFEGMTVDELTIGATTFTADDVVDISVGKSAFVRTKAFKLDGDDLYLSVPIANLETAADGKLTVKAEGQFSLTSIVSDKSIGVARVEGSGATATLSEDKKTAAYASTSGTGALKIYFDADPALPASSMIFTRKVVTENEKTKISYGMTNLDFENGFMYYVFGYNADTVTEARSLTLEYTVAVSGVGAFGLTVNGTLTAPAPTPAPPVAE